MVKNKLPPRRGSSLEEVQPHPYKGTIKFFKVFMRQLNFRISQNIQIRKLGYSRKKKTWRRGEGRGGGGGGLVEDMEFPGVSKK